MGVYEIMRLYHTHHQTSGHFIFYQKKHNPLWLFCLSSQWSYKEIKTQEKKTISHIFINILLFILPEHHSALVDGDAKDRSWGLLYASPVWYHWQPEHFKFYTQIFNSRVKLFYPHSVLIDCKWLINIGGDPKGQVG